MINNIYNRIERVTDGKVFYGVGVSPENQDNIALDAGYVETLLEYGYLDISLKQEFLELWLTDDGYEDLEALDYVQDLTYKMLLKYADDTSRGCVLFSQRRRIRKHHAVHHPITGDEFFSDQNKENIAYNKIKKHAIPRLLAVKQTGG